VTPYVTPHVTPHVTPYVALLVRSLGAAGELASPELLLKLGLRDRKHLRERYLAPSLEEGWIEMTIPDRPKSRSQRYRLTSRGRQLLATLSGEDGAGS
jgi:ATP-dependent DNA helicase RecG